jgi:hypothetical protein
MPLLNVKVDPYRHATLLLRSFLWLGVHLTATSVTDSATCPSWLLAREFFYLEDGGGTFLRNVGSHKICTAPHCSCGIVTYTQKNRQTDSRRKFSTVSVLRKRHDAVSSCCAPSQTCIRAVALLWSRLFKQRILFVRTEREKQWHIRNSQYGASTCIYLHFLALIE